MTTNQLVKVLVTIFSYNSISSVIIFIAGLLKFLDNGTQIRYDVLPKIIQKMTEIRDWLTKQTTFKLFATSILLIYEGQLGHEKEAKKFDIRLVDFAHTTLATEAECDPNCLCGVQRILEHFEQIKLSCPDL